MSGSHLSRFERGEFVAWDGEGIGRGKRHSYVMLASSRAPAIVNARGLSTVESLDYILSGVSDAPRAIHVGFAISYDVNMMLKDVPRRVLVELWKSERARWKPKGTRSVYVLSYRPRKFFRVTRIVPSGEALTATIWDVWPFFQSSFVKALEKYGVMSDAFREKIRAMKLRRSSFRARDIQAMTDYNRDECVALVALMESLLASLKSAGISITRWDGPGAIAAAILTERGFKESISAEVPDAATVAFQHAYYGGRIECLQYGRIRQTIHHYDINSAYPAAMRTLPCRRKNCGSWVYTSGGRIWSTETFAVYRVRWAFRPRMLFAFPWRSAKGSVYFPSHGAGWVWGPELHACLAMGSRSSLSLRSPRSTYQQSKYYKDVDVLGSWRWVPRGCSCGPACAWIDDLYHERFKAKARGDGAEHAIKLGLNSMYGKLAQRVGAQWKEDHWEPPPFHDLAGAGWITSTVRAQLYRAACQAPGKILMLATDGIYSLVPLALDTPKEKVLGSWSYEQHTGATIVQSGVYILDNADGTEHAYTRGFDLDAVDRAAIHRGWRSGRAHIPATHERFMGLGAALHGATRFPLWRQWVTERRDLALHPWGTKRTPEIDRRTRRPPDASRHIVRTQAFDTRGFWGDMIGGHGMMTTPSPLPWRDGVIDTIAEIDQVEREDRESEDATL